MIYLLEYKPDSDLILREFIGSTVQCVQKYAVYFYRDSNTFTIPFNTIL